MTTRPAKRRRVSPTDEAESGDGDESIISDSSSVKKASHGESNGADSSSESELEPNSDDDGADYENGDASNGSHANESASLTGNGGTSSHTTAKRTSSRTTVKRYSNHGENAAYTGDLYKSNLFRIQMDDLLEDSKLKPGKLLTEIDETLRNLKSIIERIPSREPLSVAEAEKLLIKGSKVAVPFPSPRPPKDANYKLQYEKPARINAVGSYPLKQTTKTTEGVVVDLAVTMPSSLFQEKDYLDYRYFYRRAYYIACIAAGLKDSKEKYKLSFDRLHGNYLLPVLMVSLQEDQNTSKAPSSCVRIIPIVVDGVFPPEKIMPTRSCIRQKFPAAEDSRYQIAPNPFYNGSLRQDSLVTSYLKLQHNTATVSESFRDACMLGRLWLRQHGFGSHVRSGGFGNFEWAALMALLLGQGRTGSGFLSTGYSSYQLFKGLLQFLATKDSIKTSFFSDKSDVTLPQDRNTPYVFDVSRGHNLLYKMTVWSYNLLRYEAQASINMLSDTVFDQFDATFMIRADRPTYRYDGICKIPVSSLCTGTAVSETDMSDVCHKMYQTLCRGLTDRVQLINIEVPSVGSWALGSSSSQTDRTTNVMIGFIVDPALAAKEMDHGPSQENKKDARAFRQFWGDKAELRKFSDNRVIESVKWDTVGTNSSVFEQIVTYILARHLGQGIAEASLISIDPLSNIISKSSDALASKTQKFRALLASFARLESNIRELENLPLQVRHIFPSDPLLRYSSSDLPASNSRNPTGPADVVLQFEGSGRWPDDLVAIQVMKVAFLLKLSDLLTSASSDNVTCVGTENLSYSNRNQSFLNVTYTSTGHTFRVRIHHDREASLLERQLKMPGISALEKEQHANALAAYKRDFIRRPAHTQAIQALCMRYPALSPAIRLTKAWFASHMLLDNCHLSHELVELLVARTFTNPGPWRSPGSASTAFARTMYWVAQWDWKLEPLIVDFSAETGTSAAVADGDVSNGIETFDVEAIRTRFEAWRKIDPAMNRVILFAASSVDADGTTWTDHARPAKVVAGRMTTLARAASKLIADRGFDFDPEMLFRPGTNDFDFVVRVNPKPKLTKRHSKSRDAEGRSLFKNLEFQFTGHPEIEMSSFSSVPLFVEELREELGDTVVFFYDQMKEDVIAGLWNPALEKRKWKVALRISSMPTASSINGVSNGHGEADTVQVNKREILHYIMYLGGDMVRSIETNRPI